MSIIEEKDIGEYQVMIDGYVVNLSLLVSRHKERTRAIKFHLEVNRRCCDNEAKK
jgi:hypothetical protein